MDKVKKGHKNVSNRLRLHQNPLYAAFFMRFSSASLVSPYFGKTLTHVCVLMPVEGK
jgi:hypothetical protein